MSLRPRRPRKKDRLSRTDSPNAPRAVTTNNPARLIPVEEVPRQRLTPYTSQFHLPRVRALFTLPDGRDLAQLSETGSTRSRPDDLGDDQPPIYIATEGEATEWDLPVSFSPQTESLDQISTRYFQSSATESAEVRRVRAHAKKRKQWSTWAVKTIPSLLTPFLSLLRETNSFRDKIPKQTPHECSCGMHVRQLKVVCVYFERLELITLEVCTCSTAALQLLSRGLFPCAPVAPTLAVDLKLLEFVKELFLRMPPNITGWCDTLESFLGNRKYKLTTRDTLRRRFGNALQWYGALINASEARTDSILETARQGLQLPSANPQNPSVISLPSTPAHRPTPESPSIHPHVSEIEPSEAFPQLMEIDSSPTPATSETASEQEPPNVPSTEPLLRPSEYLRRRCPACFGGKQKHGQSNPDIPDVIVCIDGNFTQKRRRRNHEDNKDGPRQHHDTVFVSTEDINEMAAYVDEKRTSANRSRQQSGNAHEDGFEAGMNVPTSVLDGCNDSFLAADEKREKASTKFFADTGLMALLCRHDRVLWVANMVSAGEKQHYALALLRRLFQQLPSDMSVGLLYDIGCQLHRSCLKWGFLQEFIHRLTFAISVFHAYGHQWPCQVVYHPRKRKGFGLSDGEGCERFWSSIKKLIPSLRVSGYHQRLLVLDEQIKHLDRQSLRLLGRWLSRRWAHCQTRKLTAEAELSLSGIDIDVLRSEWAAQVHAQTRPLPRQSQNKGKQAVEAILALQKNIEGYEHEIEDLERELVEFDFDLRVESVTDIQLRLQKARKKKSTLEANMRAKILVLGVDGRNDLRELRSSRYLQLRMNARALKLRIRYRLCERKFELERVERCYWNTANEKSLSDHTKASMKRREPTILRLAKTYNDLVEEMRKIMQRGKAPLGAIVPFLIDREGLFQLDVDDEIWQDIGLDDASNGGPIPQWLSNERVRRGIKALLELDRCIEEENRLKLERCALQEWFQEEWECVAKAQVDHEDNADMQYQLKLRATALCDLCVLWQTQLRPIPMAYPMPATWGPLEKDLREAAAEATHGSWLEDGDHEPDGPSEHAPFDQQTTGKNQGCGEDASEFDVSDDDNDSEDDDDMDLVDEIEKMLWVEAYHTVDTDDEQIDCDRLPGPVVSEASNKRIRTVYDSE